MRGSATGGVAPWRVLIVEDDDIVARLQRRLVDAMPEFRAIGTAPNGEIGFREIASLLPDLAIIDLGMPGGDGLSLVQRIRQERLPVEMIVVTASRDASTIRTVMHYGVIDYLVKPFAPARLSESLNAFAMRARALSEPMLAQEEVDLVQSTGARRIHRLPRGLRRTTLNAVRATLELSDRALTAEEVGDEVGIARVTARRYLDYLDAIGTARVERERNGPGRPRNRYRRVREAVVR